MGKLTRVFANFRWECLKNELYNTISANYATFLGNNDTITCIKDKIPVAFKRKIFIYVIHTKKYQKCVFYMAEDITTF